MEEGITQKKVPLISVITITYNASAVLPVTLASLNGQVFRDFEHLIIDGASTDDTVAVAREQSPRSMVTSEPDRGLYDAMNKGLRRACGEYVIFLNAGDAFHSTDTLANYASAIQRNAGRMPDIVYGDTVIVDAQGRYVGPRHLSAPERLDFKSFANGMLVCHQAFMVRRAIAPEYDLKYRFSADYEWTLRCLKESDPQYNYNLKQVTVDYMSDGLTDRNHKASLKERFRIMCRYYGVLPTVARHAGFLLRDIRRKMK